jgi:hypothetical protein
VRLIRVRRMWSCILVALAAAAVPAGAQDVSGLAFDVTVITGDSATGTTQTGSGWMHGNRSRLDLKGPPTPEGAIPGMKGENVSVIVRDSAGVPGVVLVDHDARKFFYPSRMAEQLQELMASLGGAAPRMTLTVGNVTVDTLGDGHTVSGFATKRYRIGADLTIVVEMLGERVEQEMRMESEADMAEDLAGFSDPLRDTRGFQALAAGLPFVDSTMTAEFDKLLRVTPRGLALRQVDRVTGVTQGGEEMKATTTLLSNVRRATFSSSVFSLPAGYTELDMPMMPTSN